MGYALQIVAMAALGFGVWLFYTGGIDPDLTWGQHMLALVFNASASISLSLAGLRRIHTFRAPYWWLSSVVFISGIVLLVGMFGSYAAGAEGADIGGMLLMFLGACGLAGAELLALGWTMGIDVAGRVKLRRSVTA